MSRRHSDSALSLKEASRRVIASRAPRLLRGLKNCDLHFLGFFLTGNPRPLKQPQLSAARHRPIKTCHFSRSLCVPLTPLCGCWALLFKASLEVTQGGRGRDNDSVCSGEMRNYLHGF